MLMERGVELLESCFANVSSNHMVNKTRVHLICLLNERFIFFFQTLTKVSKHECCFFFSTTLRNTSH